MVKKILSFICCLALCTPMITMTQTNVDNSIIASADTTNNNFNFKSSQKAVDLIKSCEGFSSKAYWDYKQWTIGYGTYVESNTTYPNGITEAQGEQLLYNALEVFEDYVNAFLKRNNVIVNQNQFDALVCFTYAIPAWSFKGNEDYTIAQMLINGCENYSDQQVYDIFGLYVKAGSGANKVTLPGLVKRRVMEASLFLYGDTTNELPQNINATSTNASDNTQVESSNTQTTDAVDNTINATTDEKISSTEDVSTTTETTTWIVSDKDGINLRHSYGLNGKKIGAIPYNATITASEIAQADGYTWGKVTYNGITGWCALDYCTQLYNVNVKCDINGDGNFFITDVCMLKAYLYEDLQLTDEQLKIADLNNDGKVDTTDYQLAVKSILLD